MAMVSAKKINKCLQCLNKPLEKQKRGYLGHCQKSMKELFTKSHYFHKKLLYVAERIPNTPLKSMVTVIEIRDHSFST